ncbi:MAG: hypothetical protein RDU20_13205 [Desulfomonilaceae bacterium]|nr:hypothetical protein [Desulfomonilaceae bacterium]
MRSKRLDLPAVKSAAQAIDRLGSDNSEMMATRAIHINVLLEQVPGDAARLIKSVYNQVGAEAAISSQAYHGEEGAITDMIAMGTVYQHREVRRVLTTTAPWVRPWLDRIEEIVENAPETVG